MSKQGVGIGKHTDVPEAVVQRRCQQDSTTIKIDEQRSIQQQTARRQERMAAMRISELSSGPDMLGTGLDLQSLPQVEPLR